MWLPLKAIMLNKPRKDGNFVIYYQYCFSSTNRVLLNTEIAIPRQFWNGKRQCISKLLPVEHGDFESLNREIGRLKNVIEAIIDHGGKNGMANIGAYVKQVFTPRFDVATLVTQPANVIVKRKEPDFFDELDMYIKSKESSLTKATWATFRIMRQRLQSFEVFRGRKIQFSCLDYNFYSDMMEYFTYQYEQKRKKETVYGLKTSTIGKTVKQFRMFIKDRVRRKVINAIDIEDFKVVDEETDAIYLSYEEIGTIYALDLQDDKTLELYRDMFVLGCLTGLRFSDYSSLKFEDLRGGLLYKKTTKLDNWVVIPLRKEAVDIFKKHYTTTVPTISNPVFNRYIKVIAQRAGINRLITFSYKKGNKTIVDTRPKCSWVTSHCCRRSFCTNEYLAGTDISLIMRISGHKTHKEFFKYIRITQEEAALKIQQVWEERSNMTAFMKLSA